MPSPFPGMDPYLERASLWRGFHNRLIVAIADEIAPQVSSRYFVDIEHRVYLGEAELTNDFRIPDVSVFGASENGDAPDAAFSPSLETDGATAVAVEMPIPAEIREGYVVVRELANRVLVTAIEILSPTNKRPGRGRALYEEKRMEFLGTWTNLVEIDLLRAGEPMRIIGNGVHSDYRILVARGGRSRAMLYPFGVRQSFPKFTVPLRRGERDEPIVDIGNLMPGIYDRAHYARVLDYAENPVPPLSDADAVWADELLKARSLR